MSPTIALILCLERLFSSCAGVEPKPELKRWSWKSGEANVTDIAGKHRQRGQNRTERGLWRSAESPSSFQLSTDPYIPDAQISGRVLGRGNYLSLGEKTPKRIAGYNSQGPYSDGSCFHQPESKISLSLIHLMEYSEELCLSSGTKLV